MVPSRQLLQEQRVSLSMSILLMSILLSSSAKAYSGKMNAFARKGLGATVSHLPCGLQVSLLSVVKLLCPHQSFGVGKA